MVPLLPSGIVDVYVEVGNCWDLKEVSHENYVDASEFQFRETLCFAELSVQSCDDFAIHHTHLVDD